MIQTNFFKNDFDHPILKALIWIIAAFLVIWVSGLPARGESLSADPFQLTTIVNLDWFSEEAAQYIDKVDGIWSRGTTAIIVDVETGIYFSASRNGGWNHADWEPETKEDTAKLKEICGGTWSWDRRAVLVLIGDKTFAASINGMPHGGNRLKDNGYGGHSCCHFLNSKLHVRDKQDPKHQQAVQEGAEASVDVVQALIDKFIERESTELAEASRR